MGYFKYKFDRGRALAEKRRHSLRPIPSELSGWLSATHRTPSVELGYVRLAVGELHTDSWQPQGIFAAAGRLKDGSRLDEDDLLRLSRALRWFNHNLVTPRNIPASAVFWFKLSASTFRTKAWPIVRILRKYGEQVSMITSRRPGKIVYRDDVQIAAVPHADRRPAILRVSESPTD